MDKIKRFDSFRMCNYVQNASKCNLLGSATWQQTTPDSISIDGEIHVKPCFALGIGF